MGWSDVYLIPAASSGAGGQPLADPRRYAERAAEVLTAMGVIDGPYDDDEGWYAAGEANEAPFLREHPIVHDPSGVVINEEIAFETCIIYGRPELTVVPLEEDVDPRCPRCGADVGTEHNATLIALLDDEGKPKTATGFADARVACPECGGSFRLDELTDALGGGIFLVNRYVNFHECFPRVRPEWLAAFNRAMGIEHTAHLYGGT